ncbi:hypothetical protein D3C72_1950220 [compost metagenome]
MVQLVAVLQAAQLHRVFIQRRETDGVDMPVQRRVHAGVQHPQHGRAAGRLRLTDTYLPGADGVHLEPGRRVVVRPVAHRVEAVHGPRPDLHARDPLALAPQPGVAHQHDVRLPRRFRHGQQAGDQFGADAGRIAQRQGDNGFLLRSHGKLIPLKCCSS